ncbi:MAG TPA: BlaI/MecI/CopY family transcriptional regulator [Acidimicrobiales bacterium]|nr:BlaI/MecI/CopY family transcriptional regulator [Acidimicrobiales bacterium]
MPKQLPAASGSCTNPLCKCTPCTCGQDCHCGTGHLGDLERRVMLLLWRRPGEEVTGREVANALPEYAYTTIATVLDRLSRKGELRRRRAGNRLVFTAIGTDSSHAARAMSDALDNAPDAEDALADFVSGLPPSRRATLRRLLDH